MLSRQATQIFHVDDWLECTHHTMDLADREIAKACREDIESWLRELSGRAVLTIDFTGVEILDYTGADELVVKLIQHVNANEYGAIALALAGTTASHEGNLTVALERAHRAIVVQRKDGPEILGKIYPFLRETFAYVVQASPLTSRAMADAWDMPISHVAERLRCLHKRRLLLRDEAPLPAGGHEYVYRPVEGTRYGRRDG